MTTTVVLERDIAAEAGVGSAALHEVEVPSVSDMTDAACSRDDVLVR